VQIITFPANLYSATRAKKAVMISTTSGRTLHATTIADRHEDRGARKIVEYG